jgi:hypothetical protein
MTRFVEIFRKLFELRLANYTFSKINILNYVVLLCIEFIILLIEEKVMLYVTVSEGHRYPLVSLCWGRPRSLHLRACPAAQIFGFVNFKLGWSKISLLRGIPATTLSILISCAQLKLFPVPHNLECT